MDAKRVKTIGLPAMLGLLSMVQIASADHDRFRNRRGAEIEVLRASATLDGRRPQVSVRYAVEAGSARHGLTLIVSLRENGRPVLDRRGRPITAAIPLTRPSDFDDGEFVFRGRTSLRLPAGAFFRGNQLTVHATLVRSIDGRALDRRTDNVEFRDVDPHWGDGDRRKRR